MHDITIGPASRLDLEAMASLIASLFGNEPDFAVDRAKQIAGLGMLLDDRPRSLVLVARDRDAVVGMLTVQLVVSTAEGGWSGLIEDVVVAEGHQSLGIGSRLVEVAEEWAVKKGATRMQLLVDIENAGAINFYGHRSYNATRMVCRRKMLVQDRT